MRKFITTVLALFAVGVGTLAFSGAAHAGDSAYNRCLSANNGNPYEVTAVVKTGLWTVSNPNTHVIGGLASCSYVANNYACWPTNYYSYGSNGGVCQDPNNSATSLTLSNQWTPGSSMNGGDCTPSAQVYGIVYSFCPNWTWVASHDLGGVGLITNNWNLIDLIGSKPSGVRTYL